MVEILHHNEYVTATSKDDKFLLAVDYSFGMKDYPVRPALLYYKFTTSEDIVVLATYIPQQTKALRAIVPICPKYVAGRFGRSSANHRESYEECIYCGKKHQGRRQCHSVSRENALLSF